MVQNSGHHAAARALEAALKMLDPGVQTLCVDLLRYTHPYWAAVIEKTYMITIRRTPEVWEALYDSPVLDRLTRRIRRLVQRGGSRTLVQLMHDFKPDAAVCTQAHPFTVLCDYARRNDEDLPLWGVVTDFVPHRFWVQAGRCRYVVPTESAADRLVWLGVEPARVLVKGIPVRPDHAREPAAHKEPRVLVMGGSRGLGVRLRTIAALDRSRAEFHIDVVAGGNQRLRKRLRARRARFRHPIRIRGYVRDAYALMQRADLLLSKPGGMTSAEAMAAGLPMLISHPLPGQERGNTEYLVRNGAAIPLERDRDVAPIVTNLLGKPAIMDMMRRRARQLGCPHAALDIARTILGHGEAAP